MSDKSSKPIDQPAPKRVLTLFDGICIIVGTIIGAGIFEIPGLVAGQLGGVNWVIAIWIIGGCVALIGAVCFAELTTVYPEPGGDYAYLKRGYHKRVGFAFSWAAFWIIRPGNIGSMALIFGKFANQIFELPRYGTLIYAVLIIVILSATNLLGVTVGKSTQNVLTVAKVIGILLIVVAAMVLPSKAEVAKSTKGKTAQESSASNEANQQSTDLSKTNSEAKSQSQTQVHKTTWSSFWLAMVLVMFAYGGWNDIAFVGAEVKNPQQNLVRALALGTLSVVVIYLLVNIALVIGLTFDRFASPVSDGSATSLLVSLKMGTWGSRFLAALVCASCAGAINGMIFTSPRIYWATAVDYPRLHWLTGSLIPSESGNRGWWPAMLLQMFVSMILVLMFGRTADGFQSITISTAIYFWAFLGLTVNCVIVCRWRYNQKKLSGFRMPFPFFPLLPIIFIAACIFMTYRGFTYMMAMKLWVPTISIAILMAVGVVISFGLGNQSDSNTQNKSP